MFSDFLTGSVGNALINNALDVKRTKRNLNRLGYFDEEPDNDYITRALDTGIRDFQRDNGLRIDGRLHPAGETERMIYRLLEGREPDEAFGPAYDEGRPGIGFGTGVSDRFQITGGSGKIRTAFASYDPEDEDKDPPIRRTIALLEDAKEEIALYRTAAAADPDGTEVDDESVVQDEQDEPENPEETDGETPEEPPENEAKPVTTPSGIRVNPEAILKKLQEQQAINERSLEDTGRLPDKDAVVPPVPERRPIIPETTRDSFDLNKAPTVNLEKDRIKSILNNDPTKFEIKENPSLENPTLKERAIQTVIKNEGFGNKIVQNHEKTIEKMAKKHGVDPDLVKSVMWAENARGHGFGTNNLADDFGVSDSQTPMNINGEIWGGLVDKPGEKLNNDEENIEAGAILLKRIGDRIENPTPEKIGSIWNSVGRENVNEIGKEIGDAYKTRPWAKKK